MSGGKSKFLSKMRSMHGGAKQESDVAHSHSIGHSTPKMTLFNRRGAKTRGSRRRSSRSGGSLKLEKGDRVEVSVPSLGESSHGHGHTSHHGTGARRVLVSATGECTPVNDDGDSIHGDDVNDFSMGIDEVAEQRRTRSLPHLSFGKLTGSFEDKVVDAFMWLRRQTKGKQIYATKEVLSTYHDSYLYGEVPFTTKVRTALRGWPLRNCLMWIEFVAAMLSVVLYIYTTYKVGANEYHWLRVVQLACGFFFVVDYIVNLYSAPVRLYYIFSIKGLVDFVSTLPIILYWSPDKNNGAAILLFLRVLRIMPVITQVGGLTGGAIREQIFILVMYTLGVVFVAAGVLQWVDNKATPQSVVEANGCDDQGCLTFFASVYFIFVTISTVGYGDITPKSNWGRGVVICVILGAVIILPAQINRILQLASRRPFGGKFTVRKVVGSRFIIISGNLTYRTVQDFLSEFYHPNHNRDMNAFPVRVVLMAPYKPSFELKTLLMSYQHQVEFIQGTPVKDSDLDRVSAKVATAFYLLADQQAKDPDAEDAAQIVRTLAVHRHCGSQVRVIVELLKPEKAASAIWDDTDQAIEIMCLDVIRFKLLARSCHVKGLSTFIINLFRTGLTVVTPLEGHWMFHYMNGLRQEVFPILLPPIFHKEGLTFEQACELVYRRDNVILFGLDIAHDEEGEMEREVLLYPKGRIIHSTDVGLGIAKNLETAERVSRFHSSTHHACVPWRKLYCMDCLEARFFPNHRPKAKDIELLERIKQGKDLDLDLESNGASSSSAVRGRGRDNSSMSMQIKQSAWVNPGKPPAAAAAAGKEKLTRSSSSLTSEDHSVHRTHGLSSHALMTRGEHHDHNLHMHKVMSRTASTGDLLQYRKDKTNEPFQPQVPIGENDHEHEEAAAANLEVKQQEQHRHLSPVLSGSSSQQRTHGISSHASMTRGEHHDQSHVHLHGLASYASMSDLRVYNNKPVDESPKKLQSQASVGKSSKRQDQPASSLSLPDMEGDKEQELDTPLANDVPEKPRRFVITLEDAIDMAMSWPPLQILDKPDPSILERRRDEISRHLKNSTLNVVKLGVPHILVCIQGKWPSSLFYFVSQLRTPGMPNPSIVILHPNEPSVADWGCVGVFQQIYFVIGSPSYELDLLRAGVLQAEKVVILTQGNSEQPTAEIANDEDNNASSSAFSLDVNNVFIAATVERLLRPIKDRVIVELQQETEIQYLRPRVTIDRRIFDTEMYRRNRVATFQFAPPYMDGKAFCPSTLNFLMFATFYNRQVMAIVDQMISGGQVLVMDNESHREHASEFDVRQLDQVPVPKPYVGQTFQELFVGMLRYEDCLPLGLYRAKGYKGSATAFVSTNPAPTDLLESTDLVYILH